MKPETMKKFLTPGAVWRRVNGDDRIVCIDPPAGARIGAIPRAA